MDIMIGEGPAARSVKIDLPPFTLVGATTRAGMLTNPLRDRFGIEEQNSAVASRIIRETLNEKLIREDDPEKQSRKFKKYVPIWAS